MSATTELKRARVKTVTFNGIDSEFEISFEAYFFRDGLHWFYFTKEFPSHILPPTVIIIFL